MNPSTAAPDALDPTLRVVDAVARANGFDGFVMLNLYPLRCTRPDDLPREADLDLLARNLQHVAAAVAPGATVWAAWGALIEKRPYLAPALRELVAGSALGDATWVARGRRSRAGHPHHPLYVRKDAPLERFDIRGYLELPARPAPSGRPA